MDLKNWLLDGIFDTKNKKRNESHIPPNVTYSTDNDENNPIQRKMSILDLSVPTNNSLSSDRHQAEKLYDLQLLQMIAKIWSEFCT